MSIVENVIAAIDRRAKLNTLTREEAVKRAELIRNLKPLRGSSIGTEWQDFNVELAALFGESQGGNKDWMQGRFEAFLTDCCVRVEYRPTVIRVIHDLAFAEVGGEVSRPNYSLTIKDARELANSGLISKLDGFEDNSFKLAIAQKLFL